MAIQKIELSAALNSLATQTSIDKVTGMLGGAAANISKADLATVVAGLLNIRRYSISVPAQSSIDSITSLRGLIFLSRSGTDARCIIANLHPSQKLKEVAMHDNYSLNGGDKPCDIYKTNSYISVKNNTDDDFTVYIAIYVI